MTPKYRIEDESCFFYYEESDNFDDIFAELAMYKVTSPYKIIEENENKDVTNEFRKYMEDTGIVFCETVEKTMNKKLLEKTEYYSNFFNVYSFNGKKGVLTSPKYSQYKMEYQKLLDKGYVDIGHYEKHKIFYERNNEASPIYKYNKQGAIPEGDYDSLVANSTILAESVESFVENVKVLNEDWKEEEEEEEKEKEKSIEIEESDRIDFDVKMATKYKGRLYSILCFKYRGVEFIYAPKVLAERINEEQDFGTEILDEVTYFITPKQMDEMYEILRKTPSWKKFWTFCYHEGIYNNSVDYHFMETVERFEGKKYQIAKMESHYSQYLYTEKEAKDDKRFIEYLKKEFGIWDVCGVSKKELERIQDFLYDGRLYQEFDRFCKDNGIPNIIPEQDFEEGDKGFDFDTSEYRKAQERKNLPEGYGEDDEETLEISEAEYGRLSQTLDRFLAKKNPRWCKDGVVEERFAEFCENVKLPSICGHIRTNIKRCKDNAKNFEFCKNNNALVHEQFRNVSRFQNALQDAIKCSNNVYTDFLNIKDLATALMDEFSANNFQKKYDRYFAKESFTEESKIEDYTLRNRYKIEGTGKTVFERVTFSSLESTFDAVYVMDIKPPFKVIDLETREDATGKVMEIAEGQNHMFIDTEEIIKRLPDSFERFKDGAYCFEYLDKKDGKQITCLNRVNFKHIIGFKDLWRRNCVPFGFKRNFILFADLTQPSTPIYRIDYRRTADFESRRLLNESFEDYFSRIPDDWEN